MFTNGSCIFFISAKFLKWAPLAKTAIKNKTYYEHYGCFHPHYYLILYRLLLESIMDEDNYSCPICKLDLSPLDIRSRNEHVEICVENGPSIIDVSETGQLVVKRNIPPNQQRKICPVCNKTFITLFTHFKNCALKYDVPPDLMMDYWSRINEGQAKPKDFPRDLLHNYITKSTKEGRVGEQVDIARAYYIALSDGDDSNLNSSLPTRPSDQPATDGTNITINNNPASLHNPTNSSTTKTETKKIVKAPKSKAKQRLETVDDISKRANICLRIDRELAASADARYRESLRSEGMTNNSGEDVEITLETNQDEIEITRIFSRAKLKRCNNSKDCLNACCQDHELELLLPDFGKYSGTLIH